MKYLVKDFFESRIQGFIQTQIAKIQTSNDTDCYKVFQ